ncbi:hypothetical protein FB561_7256 [Kribbella amoyensis]|uniref:PH (Pleckstrin Homology) domain-containing protein n=1 Tax=Kribbella amoyensis TaxID=996641 RepID=A0A561B3D9_9ACTN|nr:hypothetical protein [Kribbella amoyensis]TWD73367.1 hypothetical protein FB561_7256 [Kribbella amoyensis]
MSPAGTWTAEFEASGRVVFPPRRNRLLIRLALVLVLFGNSLWSNLEHLRADDVSGALGILRITALAAFAYLVGLTVWQLATGRPVVTIDGTGISRGDRTRLGWHQIARIDEPSGLPGLRTVQVHPTERSAGPVGIPQDNVLELGELARWLRTVHDHRRNG